MANPMVTGSWTRLWLRLTAGFFLFLLMVASSGLVYLLNGLSKTYDEQLLSTESAPELHRLTLPFPVSVDPKTKHITETANIEAYLQAQFATEYDRTIHITWLDRLYDKVAYLPLYQSLATPNSRILVIFAGQRKEEVAQNFGRILGWNRSQREEFITLMNNYPVTIAEGTLYPGKYIVSPDATPEAVAAMVQQTFINNVLSRYPESLEVVVPLHDALTIASMIERETNSFAEMRVVSAVIWNRLFSDMKLQIDATLQYVRGSQNWEQKWWPVPVPSDKYIKSAFNTYQNKGLPPGPIANPSAAAILAALNPVETDCLYYFHANKVMECSSTYEEHVADLKATFGRGR